MNPLPSPTRQRRTIIGSAALLALALAAAACTSTSSEDTASASPSKEPASLTLVAYDSFTLPKEVWTTFEKESNIRVKVLTSGDTGEMVNKAILTKDTPIGDVLWGVDTTSLQPALDANLFVAHEAANAADLDPALRALVPGNEVTPVDFGDVCVNVDKAALQARGLTAPTSFDDLRDQKYKDLLVVQNPATSSPGLAFLLATIAQYGPTGWESYWKDLRANGVKVVNGWTEAYEGSFTAGGGKGDRPMVVSYGSSPPAAVLFGPDPKATEAPTAVVDATCYRQVEFAGILAGTKNEALARELVDFLASPTVQNELPLNLFVYPANVTTPLPKLFVDFAAKPAKPLALPASDIAANRQAWIDTWTSIVL